MVPDKPQKVENFHFTWCGYIGFSARCYVNRNEYTEYRFLNHCMALLYGFNWSILQKMQVWLRGDVLWCFFGSHLSMVVVSFDRMLYIFVEDSSCLHQIAGIGYSKLSVLNWVSLIRLFTVFLWTISWANFLKNYLFNLVFIAQPIGLKAFLSCLSSSSPFYEP